MPPAIGAVVVMAASGTAFTAAAFTAAMATTAASVIGHGAMLLASAGYANSQKRRARRDFNASLTDRTTSYRSSDAPRTITYGRTRVSGPLNYIANHGEKRRITTMVVVLGAHPFDAIEDIWFDDQSIVPYENATGIVQAGSKWFKSNEAALTYPGTGENSVIAGGNGSTITIANIPAGHSLVRVDSVACVKPYVFEGEGGAGASSASLTLTPPGTAAAEYSISGNTITLLSDNYVGFMTVVTYRTSVGDAYAVARPFLGSLSGERDNAGGYSPGGLEEATATDSAPWTAQHLGCGIPRLHVSVSYDETIYASGLPNISAVVRGKKVYDPRLDSTVGGLGAHRVNDPTTWSWSRNSALCAADYLMDELGFGVLPSEINWEAVAVAAYICDDWLMVTTPATVTSVSKASNAQVVTAGVHGLNQGDHVHFSSVAGMAQINNATFQVTKVTAPNTFEIEANSTLFGTFTSGNWQKRQRRFTCDGVLSTEADRKANLEQLLGSMVGTCFYSGGVFTIRAASFVTPSITLDETDLADGSIALQARPPRSELFNCVQGRFRNRAKLFAIDDFKPYRGNTVGANYVAEDSGEEIWQDFEFPFTADAHAAQRLAKLILWRHRNGLVFEANWKLSTIGLQPGDTVYLKLKKYGWDTLNGGLGKIFRVVEREFAELRSVRLTLQEEASVVYDWGIGDATVLDPAPNTALPAANYVDPITPTVFSDANTFYVRSDRSTVNYVLIEWALPTALDVHLEIWAKRTIDTAYERFVMPVGGTSYRLEGVAAGDTLNMRFTAVNSLGARSTHTDLPQYTVSPLLPASNTIVPQSQNLLTNASFEYSADRWQATGTDAVVYKENSYPLRGVPSNLRLEIANAFAGVGQVRFAYSELIPVNPQLRYVAFAGLIGWGTDALVSIAWYTASEASAGPNTDSPNLIPAAVVESSERRPNRLDHYRRSTVFAKPPAGASYARVLLVAGGTWLPGSYRYLWAVEPFFGVVSDDVDLVPTWGPGGSPVLGTFGLQENSTARVYSNALPAPVTVSITEGGPVAGLPVITLPIDDPTIPVGATLTVRCNVVLSAIGRAGTVGTITNHRVVLGVLVGEYVGGELVGGGTYGVGYFWDHLWSSPRAISGLDLAGSAGGTFVVQYVAGREMRMQLVVQQQTGENSNSYTYTCGVGTSISVEVLKR